MGRGSRQVVVREVWCVCAFLSLIDDDDEMMTGMVMRMVREGRT